MIWGLLRPLATLVAAGLLAVALLLFSGLDRALVLDVYLVFAGAVVLLVLVRVTGTAARPGGPSAFERALRGPAPAPARPERLQRLEGQVHLATATASDFHFGLRPLLRAATAHRLRTRLGIELDAEPARAAERLPAETWELVRPDREPPAERFGPGVPQARLRRALAAIEEIG